MDLVAGPLVLERARLAAAQLGRAVARVAAPTRCAAAALLGASWAQFPVLAPCAALIVPLWWRARTRGEAGALGALYQLGATLGLTSGAARYLGVSPGTAACVLVAAAALVGLGWCVCWVRAAHRRIVVEVLVVVGWLLITTLPCALGAIMVAHPLAVAGFWFPGAGWCGLLLTSLIFVGAAHRLGVALIVGLSIIGALRGEPRAPIDRAFEGVRTSSAPAAGEYDFLGQHRVAQEAQAAARLVDAPIVVLPEGAAGNWTAPMRDLWAPYALELVRSRRVGVLGAALERHDGRLDNAAVVIGTGGERVVRQRQPLPIAMWRPWSTSGFAAHPWDSGTIDVGDRTLGVLICWEGALVLPTLLSIAAGADALVVLANHAWVGAAGSPTLLGPQLFGALFDLPVVIALNAQGGDDA